MAVNVLWGKLAANAVWCGIVCASAACSGVDDDSTTQADLSGLVAACEAQSGGDPCKVFRSVNEQRVGAGLDPYQYDTDLAEAAQAHSNDMVAQGYFSHTSKDGRRFTDRVAAAGYTGSPTGENIAQAPSAERAMSMWMSSQGHRANILSQRSTEIGVGLRGSTWVQVFGSR